MEIIERYIYAIQRRLPLKTRDDITKEIKSLIFDELEGNFGKKDTYEEKEIEQVLVEMGRPRTVAARYRGDKQYLIGPEIFPYYKMVLAIAAGATTLGLLISFIVSCFSLDGGSWEGMKLILGFVGSVFSAMLGLVGGVTIAFAIIERVSNMKCNEINFDDEFVPKDLPELPEEKEKVTLVGSIFSIVFTIIWIVVLNTFVRTGNIPFVYTWGENVQILPVFDAVAMRQYLPYWNLSAGLSLVLYMILIRTGKWQLGTRLIEILISIVGVAVLIFMLKGPMVITTAGIVEMFGSVDWLSKIETYYRVALRVLIGLSSLGVLVNAIKLIVQQSRKANV